MNISDLNFDQILGGVVLGWFTLGIFTMIMQRCLKGSGGWIKPPGVWPRPRDKTVSIELNCSDCVTKTFKEALDEYHLNSPRGEMNEYLARTKCPETKHKTSGPA